MEHNYSITAAYYYIKSQIMNIYYKFIDLICKEL